MDGWTISNNNVESTTLEANEYIQIWLIALALGSIMGIFI